MSTAVCSFDLKLVIGLGIYDLANVQVQFAANGVNVALVTLAVGTSKTGRIPNINFARGDTAKIGVTGGYITSTDGKQRVLNSAEYTLFEGVVDDIGCNLSFGSFGMQVRLLGRLAWLASGTLQSSSLVPKSYLDADVVWNQNLGTNAKDEKEEAKKIIDVKKAYSSFWQALQECLVNIAKDTKAPAGSITKEIQTLFGTDTNWRAAEILSGIKSNLFWKLQTKEIIDGIVESINTLFGADWMYESFFNRIVSIGEMLHFKILEIGSVIHVVPHVPFFLKTQAYVIYPETYNSITPNNGGYVSYKGCVLASGANKDNITDASLIIGKYKRTDSNLGQVFVGTAPLFLCATGYPQFHDPSADKSRSFTAKLDKLGDEFAKITCWDMNYEKRGLTVSCPMFRSDVAPLTAVRVDFPQITEIQYGVDTPALYGCVQKVTITADATRQIANTTFEVSHVRSYIEQKGEIDRNFAGHPLWTLNYTHGRLDERTPTLR